MVFEWVAIVWLLIMLVVLLAVNLRSRRVIEGLKSEKSEEVKKAMSEAEKIIKEAKDRAVKIIGEAEINAEKWRQVADQEMEKLTNQQLGEYKEKLQKISVDIEEDVKSGAEDLKNTLEQEALGVEKSVVKKIESGLADAEKELEAYREEKVKQIEKKAEFVLETVVKKVFGKSIRPVDHETLIVRALEEAKRENAI